jgi:hypothetical protein
MDLLLSTKTISKPLPLEDESVIRERADCNSVFADKFDAYGQNLDRFSSSSSGGLCSIMIRCGQRTSKKLSSFICRSKNNGNSNKSNSNQISYVSPRPSLNTLRKRQRREGSLWSGSVSPNGCYIACVSPFKKGFWLLTINETGSSNSSSTNNYEQVEEFGRDFNGLRGVNMDDRSCVPLVSLATGQEPRQRCIRVRRPELDRDDFLNVKRSAPASFVSRVAWNNTSDIVAILVDDGRIQIFDRFCRPLSRSRWFPQAHETGNGGSPTDHCRGIDIVFTDDTTLCVLFDNCVIRRYDLSKCCENDGDDDEEVEVEEGVEDSHERNEDVQVFPILQPIDMPDLNVNRYFSSVHRIILVPKHSESQPSMLRTATLTPSVRVWVFGLTHSDGENQSGSGDGSKKRKNCNEPSVGCWDLSMEVGQRMMYAPIPIPIRGEHEIDSNDDDDVENEIEKEKYDEHFNNEHWCRGRFCRCCLMNKKDIPVHPHATRSVSCILLRNNNGRLAVVDMTGVLSIYNFNATNGQIQLIFSGRNFPNLSPLSAAPAIYNAEKENNNGKGESSGLLRRRNRYASFVENTNDSMILTNCVLPLIVAIAFVRNDNYLMLLHDN